MSTLVVTRFSSYDEPTGIKPATASTISHRDTQVGYIFLYCSCGRHLPESERGPWSLNDSAESRLWRRYAM